MIGSGSTGWIKSIVNVEPDVVRDIIWERDKLAIPDKEAKAVSQIIKKKYLLPSEGKNMFYVVREAILQTEDDLRKSFKGTATEIIVQSAVKSGVICIDSNIQRKVGFGERFKLEPAPKQLNCIKLKF